MCVVCGGPAQKATMGAELRDARERLAREGLARAVAEEELRLAAMQVARAHTHTHAHTHLHTVRTVYNNTSPWW